MRYAYKRRTRRKNRDIQYKVKLICNVYVTVCYVLMFWPLKSISLDALEILLHSLSQSWKNLGFLEKVLGF